MSTTKRLEPIVRMAACCAAATLLAAAAPAAMAQSQCEGVAGNLVANCGFEQRVGNSPVATDWATGGPGSVVFTIPGLQNTGNRSMVLVFDPPGSAFASQLVGGAGTYNVSFALDLYSQGVPSAPVPTLSVTFGDQTLDVSGLAVDNRQDPIYTPFQFFNVTTATPALLRFEASGNLPAGNQYVNFLVDDVVVTAVPSAIPEPSSIVLALTGLAGLALVRRRQRAARP